MDTRTMNQTSGSHHVATRIVAAALVAIGVLAVSVMVMIWVIGIMETWHVRSRVYENIVVRPNGEPVIRSYASGGVENIAYRALQGEPLNIDGGGRSSAHLPPPPGPPLWFDWPLGWGQSLGVNDSAKPRGAWYLVRDAEPEGRGYFIGYDTFSRLPIGYLGRSGFRQSMPPKSDWFEFGRRPFGYGGVAASVQQMSYNSLANLYDYGTDRETLRPWKVFLIDADRVVEADLRSRTVRPLIELPEITSIGLLTEVVDKPEDGATADRNRRFVHRLAMRSADRLVVLNPYAGTKREFQLPESVRTKRFEVYSLRGESIILNWQETDEAAGQIQQLAWIAPDGSIEREESVQLAQLAGANMSPQTASLAFAGGAPVPLVWAAFTGPIMPIGMVQSHEVPSFAAGVAKTLDMSWPGQVVVIALGCLSTIVV